MCGADRDALLAFLIDAFDGDFDLEDLDHALGGVHVVAEDGSGLIGHAAVVQRRVLIGRASADSQLLRTGYVEAVAVAARARRRGIGDALMTAVDAIIDRGYDIGLLAASEAGRPLYVRHGWTPWTGPLGVLDPAKGPQPTPGQNGGVLARTTPVTADVDLTASLYCDWRLGAVW